MCGSGRSGLNRRVRNSVGVEIGRWRRDADRWIRRITAGGFVSRVVDVVVLGEAIVVVGRGGATSPPALTPERETMPWDVSRRTASEGYPCQSHWRRSTRGGLGGTLHTLSLDSHVAVGQVFVEQPDDWDQKTSHIESQYQA